MICIQNKREMSFQCWRAKTEQAGVASGAITMILGGERSRLSIDSLDLALLMKRSDCLEALTVIDVRLLSDKPWHLSNALSSCVFLKRVKLSWCPFHKFPSPEAIGEALGQLPLLEEIKISCANREQAGWKTVLPALQRPGNTLRKIYVNERGPPISNDGPGASFTTTSPDLKLILHACQTSTVLEELTLRANGFGKPEVLAAATLIRQTSSLKSLELGLFDSCLFCFFEDIAAALNDNDTLKKLCLDGRPDLGVVVRASYMYMTEVTDFLNVLSSRNFTLEELNLFPWLWGSSCGVTSWAGNPFGPVAMSVDEMKTQIAMVHFLVKLNQSGRAKLLANGNKASTEEWLETLGNYKDDVSVLFYYLQQNPALCRVSAKQERLRERS